MKPRNRTFVSKITDYKYETQPFLHQEECFLESRNKKSYALFMEQGCGKTKVLIDNAAWLFEKKKIDSIVVFTPNGVHHNWAEVEIPIHFPKRLEPQIYLWEATKAKSKRKKIELESVMEYRSISIFLFNMEGVYTEPVKKVLRRIWQNRKILMIVDESDLMLNMKSRRTKTLINFGQTALYKRISTGTPIEKDPSNLFAQFWFLDPNILGFDSSTAFMHEYCDFYLLPIKEHVKIPVITGAKKKTIDKLYKLILPNTFFISKDECLDLPPKLYQKRYFKLSLKTQKVYDQLESEFYADYEDMKGKSQRLIEVFKLTRMLRLHQVACGYFPDPDANGDDWSDKNNLILIDEKDNQRLSELKRIIQSGVGNNQFTIWARFKSDVTLILEVLDNLKIKTGRVDSVASDSDKKFYIKEFTSGKLQSLVLNAKSAGRGYTWTNCSHAIGYSSYFGYRIRRQWEDRFHRVGMKNPVTYYDLIAVGTEDEHIIKSMIAKHDVSEKIQGREPRGWI